MKTPRVTGAFPGVFALLAACGGGSAAVAPVRAPDPAVLAPVVRAPPPECGEVDVEDHSVPPDPVRVTVARQTTRQKLAALGACTRPYHLRVNLTVDQVGEGRLRVKIRAVVYRRTGEVVADIPTTLSAEHAIPEERASKEAELLRSGAESTALLFADHFR